MSRVVHFEIAAKEPQKAIGFYSSVLDWKFQKSENTDTEYWHVWTGDERRPASTAGSLPGTGSVPW